MYNFQLIFYNFIKFCVVLCWNYHFLKMIFSLDAGSGVNRALQGKQDLPILTSGGMLTPPQLFFHISQVQPPPGQNSVHTND